MSWWSIEEHIGDCRPFPAQVIVYKGETGERMTYVPEGTTTRNTTRTVYGNKRPVCEVCGYGIGDKRWGYCPKCGSKIVEVDE